MPYLDNKGVQHLWKQLSLKDYPNNETLVAVINAIDAEKADKNKPILKDVVSFRDSYNGSIATIDFSVTLDENNAVTDRMSMLYLGVPQPPTEEEKSQMSEDEKEATSDFYGDATTPAVGILGMVGFDGTSMNMIYPSFSSGYKMNILPRDTGEIITDTWIENHMDDIANSIIDKLPTYTGGDY